MGLFSLSGSQVHTKNTLILHGVFNIEHIPLALLFTMLLLMYNVVHNVDISCTHQIHTTLGTILHV